MVELAWGVELVELGVEVCRVGVEVWCRGVEARAQVCVCVWIPPERPLAPVRRGRVSGESAAYDSLRIVCMRERCSAESTGTARSSQSTGLCSRNPCTT